MRFESLTKVIPNRMLIEQREGGVMAAEVSFETGAQSTGLTILPELPRSLVRFRSTGVLVQSQPATRSTMA